VSQHEIRLATEADLPAIAEIEASAYSNPWHPDTFRSLLRQSRAKVLVAEDKDGGVAGYAVYWWVLEQAELANLAVRGDQQGQGLGGAILDRALLMAGSQGVESVFLEVRVSNESARRLYASRGFRQISVREGYYQNPKEDALILVRNLRTVAAERREEGKGHQEAVANREA
jgi:ribosomal-protein-alanine N-acetyltransferase